ncbi:uncharacterized protein LOC122261481 [Penaeus japonicus]|uniref:uncharacterized protein LOC122261481 n=1 Tax=Penaeus japonicus TaxID=27405 RepID=UPI001C7161DA|nr:uncharacterized protein LOC122261481 [Penaeus japonicus]
MRTLATVVVLMGLFGAGSLPLSFAEELLEGVTAAEGRHVEGLAGSSSTCQCQDLSAPCICTEPSGFIVQIRNSDLGTYRVDIGKPSSLVVFFRRDDLPNLNSICNFQIGDQAFNSKTSLPDKNFVVVDTDVEIVIMTAFCNEIKLMYYTFPKEFDKNVTVLESPEGTLLAPPDQTGYFNYQPMVQYLWVLDVGPVGSKIDLTLDWIDLGGPTLVIHDEAKLNVSHMDFLLIGPGQDVLGGTDAMFFGRRDEPRRIKIPTNVAHVFFYSEYSFYNSTGFNITYTSTGPEVTDPPVSTTTTESPPAPITLQTNTFVAVNGLPPEGSISNIPTFRRVMAEMSSDYVKESELAISTSNVTYKMVQILNAATCNPFHCNGDCVAYNFSVGALDPKGNWVFTKEVLDDMLQKKDINQYKNDWQECNEESKVVSWIYYVTAVALVLVGVALALSVWRCSSADRIKDSRLAFEQQERQKRDDMRRRSSGDVSMIGIGGSISSRGSLASRRFTMPFPKPGKPDDDDDNDLHYDMSDFKEYDPDLGRVDPQEFGLQKDFLADVHAVTYFSNEAFEGDDDTEKTIFRRKQDQVPDLPGTDSEDSDGGAVSFSSFKKSPSHFTFSADIHDMDGSGETAL